MIGCLMGVWQLAERRRARVRRPHPGMPAPVAKAGAAPRTEKQADVKTVLKARSRMVSTKNTALDKLEHGKTLDYDVQTLQMMSHRHMIETCARYHLPHDGGPEELRSRLAELLLRERMRSNAYKKAQAVRRAATVVDRADEQVDTYEMVQLMHEEEFSGLSGMTAREHEAAVQLETKKRVAAVASGTAKTSTQVADIMQWYESFSSVDAPEGHLDAVERALEGMATADWVDMKDDQFRSKEKVKKRGEQVIDQVHKYKGKMEQLEKAIEKAQRENAENARKVEAAKHQHERLERQLAAKTDEKDAVRARELEANKEAKKANEDLAAQRTEWDKERGTLEAAEAELQKKIDAAKAKYAAEEEERRGKLEAKEQAEREKIAKQNEGLMEKQAAEQKRFLAAQQAKLEELCAEVTPHHTHSLPSFPLCLFVLAHNPECVVRLDQQLLPFSIRLRAQHVEENL